jgi:hypothetical protein
MATQTRCTYLLDGPQCGCRECSTPYDEDTLSGPVLYDYRTGDTIREATPDELAASVEAARHDGGAGVILTCAGFAGRSCFVLA